MVKQQPCWIFNGVTAATLRRRPCMSPVSSMLTKLWRLQYTNSENFVWMALEIYYREIYGLRQWANPVDQRPTYLCPKLVIPGQGDIAPVAPRSIHSQRFTLSGSQLIPSSRFLKYIPQ